MNLLTAVVTKVLGEPEQKYGRWWVEVEYNCWGQISTTKIMKSGLADALAICPGYTFDT